MVNQKIPTVYCTNEDVMDAGEVSRRIHKSLMTMWAGTKDDEEIWKEMDEYLKVYDLTSGTNDIHEVNNFVYWNSPQVLIMDSLDNANFPKGTEKYQEGDRHRERANFFARMTKDNNCFTVMLGNGSKSEQQEIMKDIYKVNIPMAYGSVWYHNLSSYSFVFCRDRVNTLTSDIKRCKNRGQSGSIGEVMFLEYDKAGGYYDQPHLAGVTP